MRQTEDNAMFSPAFPVNPRPFLRALAAFLVRGGNVTSGYAKRILWVLNAQAFGQFGEVNLANGLTDLAPPQAANWLVGAADGAEGGTDAILQAIKAPLQTLSRLAYPEKASGPGKLDLMDEWSVLHEAYDPEEAKLATALAAA